RARLARAHQQGSGRGADQSWQELPTAGRRLRSGRDDRSGLHAAFRARLAALALAGTARRCTARRNSFADLVSRRVRCGSGGAGGSREAAQTAPRLTALQCIIDIDVNNKLATRTTARGAVTCDV